MALTSLTQSLMTPPRHGGDLDAAMLKYRIPAANWLDLSAAINPMPYPLPTIPENTFQQLPLLGETLLAVAREYYGCESLVAAAGSQPIIQWLPLLRPRCRVAVPNIGYREHAFRWAWSGHQVIEYDVRVDGAIDVLLHEECIDVLVVINPHNPLATVHAQEKLAQWLQHLQQHDGWLIVDEAFGDALPQFSMARESGAAGLIVLRSLGKFFGLAGARCGFALCAPALAEPLRIALGPWALSGPAAHIAIIALRDYAWQQTACAKLAASSAACARELERFFPERANIFTTALFVAIELKSQRARYVQHCLAEHGVWVRLVECDADSSLLRFALVDAAQHAQWLRLQAALAAASLKTQHLSAL